MLITNDFEVAKPVAAVWDFFGDIPRVASCLPGAELTETLGRQLRITLPEGFRPPNTHA